MSSSSMEALGSVEVLFREAAVEAATGSLLLETAAVIILLFADGDILAWKKTIKH